MKKNIIKTIIIIMLLTTFLSFKFSNAKIYSYKEIDLFLELLNYKINDNQVRLYLSFKDLIINILLVAESNKLNNSFYFYPENINNIIFSIIDKNQVLKFIEKKNIENNIEKMVNEVNKGYSLSFLYTNNIYYFILSNSLNDKDKTRSAKDYILFQYRFYDYYLFESFYIQFYEQLNNIYEKLKEYIIKYVGSDEIKKLLELNYNNLKVSEDCNIILVPQIYYYKNDDIIKLFFSYFTSFTKDFWFDNIIRIINFDEIYNDYLKFYEGSYIFSYFPDKNDYNFFATVSHEFFHFYQDDFKNGNFRKSLENYIDKDDELKIILEDYISSVNELINKFKEKYQNSNDKNIQILILMMDTFQDENLHTDIYEVNRDNNKNFIRIYGLREHIKLFSNILSFHEVSAVIYELWLMKRYYNLVSFDVSYKNIYRFIIDCKLDKYIFKIEDITDINFWAKVLKIYLNYCKEQLDKNIIYKLIYS